ncbi:FAD:protein FMN transferase [Schaalia suimastitidis]|uniref:FAD:protein FMN transferase n=1 Tax=Schaalia suimastitidis TaxID=121163 RepID=UPI000688F6E1|nr:FAD:protein FMN transferase [Schaalia suimastitidis]
MSRAPLIRREIEAWGTIITIDVPANGDVCEREKLLDEALPALVAQTEDIDRALSPYRAESPVSALRRGAITERDLEPFGDDGDMLADVIEQCRQLRHLTDGAFDPWTAPGGFDPCGYVKGWGAQQLADLAWSRGLSDVCVNAAGDIATRGRPASGRVWCAGIAHPEQPQELCAVVDTTPVEDIDILRGAVATSGFSQQTGHVSTDSRGGAAPRATQATVVGPDAGIADAMATALLIDGTEGARWFNAFADSDLTIGRSRSRWGAIVIENGKLWRMGGLAH